MFKKFLIFAGAVMVISLAWAGGFAQAKETSKPLPKFKTRVESSSDNNKDFPNTIASDSNTSSSSAGFDTPTPTPIKDTAATSAASTPSPVVASTSPTATPTSTPSPSNPPKQVALGFLDLFKKTGPTDSSGGASPNSGLNFLSAGAQNSPYADGSGMSSSARRNLYGAVLVLSLLGATMIIYERTKRTV